MSAIQSTSLNARARRVARQALDDVRLFLPYLGEIADLARVYAHPDVPTAAVSASGDVFVGPVWFGTLSRDDALYVMAHELWHLVLRTHERGEETPRSRQLFNVAHDYIINDILSDALGRRPPRGGLEWPGAAERSAEEIVRALERRPGRRSSGQRSGWRTEETRLLGDGGSTALEEGLRAALGDALGAGPPDDDPLDRDALSEAEAARLRRYAEARATGRALVEAGVAGAARARMEAAGRRSLDRAGLTSRGAGAQGRFGVSDGSRPPTPGTTTRLTAGETDLRLPFERALQRGLDFLAPPSRSFARPSRRQDAVAGDVVLPGRKREGWMLNLLLDTSGSMIEQLERVMGAICASARAGGVERVNIIQSSRAVMCAPEDVEIERVELDALEGYELEAGGDTDLAPAFARFEAEPDVETVAVVTDLGEPYPERPPRFEVLWFAVPEFGGRMLDIEMAYGHVVPLDIGPAEEPRRRRRRARRR